MIFSYDPAIAIYTPPKTGSTSLHSALCKDGPFVYVVGPQFETGEIEKHTVHRPYFGANAKYYMVVRNPYDRLLSLWRHAVYYHGAKGPFERFFQYYCLADEKTFYSTSLLEFYLSTGTEPSIVQLEEIDKLEKVVGPFTMPHEHKGAQLPHFTLTQKDKDMILESHFGSDFALGRYDT